VARKGANRASIASKNVPLHGRDGQSSIQDQRRDHIRDEKHNTTYDMRAVVVRNTLQKGPQLTKTLSRIRVVTASSTRAKPMTETSGSRVPSPPLPAASTVLLSNPKASCKREESKDNHMSVNAWILACTRGHEARCQHDDHGRPNTGKTGCIDLSIRNKTEHVGRPYSRCTRNSRTPSSLTFPMRGPAVETCRGPASASQAVH
jgi:hypothetical protein